MNRLITANELLDCYRIKAKKTLWVWGKAKVNPLPKPVYQGKSSPNLWYENDLLGWELAKYGRPVITAYLDRRDNRAALQQKDGEA